MMQTVQTVATSQTGAVHDKGGWCFVVKSISPVTNELREDNTSDASSGKCILAMVTDDREREDVSTTASDGDVSVCNKRSKKRATRTEDQEMLDLSAVHNSNEEKITITIDSGTVASAKLMSMTREQGLSSGHEIENTGFRIQGDAQGEERVHAVQSLAKTLASVNKTRQMRGRPRTRLLDAKVRLENGLYVIDV